MAIDEALKGLKTAADTFGLSKFPVGVSIVVALLCGYVCYRILTYTPKTKLAKRHPLRLPETRRRLELGTWQIRVPAQRYTMPLLTQR